VIIWNLDAPGKAYELYWPTSPGSFSFSPDSQTIVVGYGDGSVRLFDLTSGENIFHSELGTAGGCTFTWDGKGLLPGKAMTDDVPLNLARMRDALSQVGLDW
jgi:WD40 repeat protein